MLVKRHSDFLEFGFLTGVEVMKSRKIDSYKTVSQFTIEPFFVFVLDNDTIQ